MTERDFSAGTHKSEARNPKSETNSKFEYQNVQNSHRHFAPNYYAANDFRFVSFEFLPFWLVSDLGFRF